MNNVWMNCIVSHHIPFVKMSEQDAVTLPGLCWGSQMTVYFPLLASFSLGFSRGQSSRSQTLESTPGLTFQHFWLSTLELWISHFIFLSFIFLIFKIRIVTPTSKCHCENEMKEYKISHFTFMIRKVLTTHPAFKSPHLNLNSAVRLNVQNLFLDISSLCPKHLLFSTSYSVSSSACHYSSGHWAHPVSIQPPPPAD